jgi:diguanylate cyclase (GGDEF)-like protein
VLFAASLPIYLAFVFVGLARVEVPGLGIGQFLYIPIALVALATGPLWGAVGGALSAGMYTAAIGLNPHLDPDRPALSISSGVRLFTFVAVGLIVGAAARSNRQLMGRLKEHAERDYLTDLLNTRAFEEELGRRLADDARFALVLADVDDLKRVNDTQGHAAGNDHLRRLAAVLREETAPDDVVARIGGDEFAVLAAEEGEALAGRLRAAAAARGLSASFGWADHTGDEADQLSLFRAADKRLYAGKVVAPPQLKAVR